MIVIGQGSQGQLSGAPFPSLVLVATRNLNAARQGLHRSDVLATNSVDPPVLPQKWSATGTRFGRWMLDGCNTSVSGCKARCSAAFHIGDQWGKPKLRNGYGGYELLKVAAMRVMRGPVAASNYGRKDWRCSCQLVRWRHLCLARGVA